MFIVCDIVGSLKSYQDSADPLWTNVGAKIMIPRLPGTGQGARGKEVRCSRRSSSPAEAATDGTG